MNGDRLLLNYTQSAIYSGTFTPEFDNPKIVHGKHVLNEVEFIVYPKDVDTANIVLFNLDEPLFIPELATKRFTGFFSDPDSGLQIGGTQLVPLVSGTSYQAYQYSTASGTNYTANLRITVTPKVNCAIYEVTNSGVGAYLTTLIQQGKGIYPRSPLNTIAENSESQHLHGIRGLSIRQPYQQTIDLGEEESAKILDIERTPRNVLIRATFNANASDLNMQSFMHLDIGSLVKIINGKPAVNSYYHINGMKWRMEKGGSIDVTWICKEMPSFAPIAVEFNGSATNTGNGVDFGKPAELSNLDKVSYSMWVNFKNPPSNTAVLMGKYAGTAQKVLVVFGDGKMRFVAGRNTTDGQWVTTNANLTGSLSADRWLHICVTYDGSSTANDPKIYITGSSVVLTEESTPAGAMDNDRNVRFIVGNAAFSGSIEWSYHPDFVWKNARVYNRELSASEVATLSGQSRYRRCCDGWIGVARSLCQKLPLSRISEYPTHHSLSTVR